MRIENVGTVIDDKKITARENHCNSGYCTLRALSEARETDEAFREILEKLGV